MGIGSKKTAKSIRKSIKEEDRICKNCGYWKNDQRELNYIEDIGFCVNDKFKYNTLDGRKVGVYDKENKKAVEGNPTHNFESAKSIFGINFERYILQTQEEFGCNCFKLKKELGTEQVKWVEV